MNVDALVHDVQSSNWQLVDHDFLRGACFFDLRPHPLNVDCGCYHCSRITLYLDQDEHHDSKFCPCTSCFIIRERVKRAEKRAEAKANQDWADKLLRVLEPKIATLQAECERILKKEKGEGMFDLIKHGLRS